MSGGWGGEILLEYLLKEKFLSVGIPGAHFANFGRGSSRWG